MTTLCTSQRALSIIYFTAAVLGVCWNKSHYSGAHRAKKIIKGFFCTEPKWAKEPNQLIRVIGLMFLISQRVVCTEQNG